MNMNVQLCEVVMEIETELKMFENQKRQLEKENRRTWDQLVWMAKGYLDRKWEVELNKQGRVYSNEKKTFVDANGIFGNGYLENEII